MPPDVTVVIPAYNAQRTLGAAIKSALRQEGVSVEVLVVDDGSTDGTAQVAEAFGSPVRLLRQAQAGPAAARNLGGAEARAPYVAFLDADDLWLPEKVRRQVEVLERLPEVTAVQTGAYAVNDRLEVVEMRPCQPRQDHLIDFLLLRNLPAFSSSVMIRKEAFVSLGGFATDLIMETWDMACRIARQGRLYGLPECLVLYRQHASNRSRRVDSHLETGLRALTRFFDDPSLDPGVRAQQQRVWGRFYAMLSGGYLRNRQWVPCLRWAGKAMATAPSVTPYVLGMPWRRLTRVVSLPRRLSFEHLLPDASALEQAP